jgi:hypothetical protein
MSWRASAYIKALVMCPNGERISRTEKLVGLVLADSHQDKASLFTFPSVRMIAEDSLMDERVARRLLASLERKGVIERERAESQGRGQTTFYRFPALDGARVEKGGHGVPLPDGSFSGKRGTEGGRKEDKTGGASIEEQEQEQKQKLLPLTPSLREGEDGRKENCHEGTKEKSAEGMAAGDGGTHLVQSGIPTPSVQRLEQSGDAESLDRAVDQVCSALGVANPRRRHVVRRALAMEAGKGHDPPDVAQRMIAAWNRQASESPNLRVKYGIKVFFDDGYWLNEFRWHWDEERLRLNSEAKTGSWG